MARAQMKGMQQDRLAETAYAWARYRRLMRWMVLAAILATLGLLATPLFNTLTRTQEADADRFSLEHAHEPDGLAKALVKTIAYRASSPSAVEEFIFYDHPSVERRVRMGMDYKAAYPEQPERR